MSMRFPSSRDRIRAWSKIYSEEGYRWGMTPSIAAHMALVDVEHCTHGKGRLLDIGCGYCRDLLLFRTMFSDLELEGLEPAAPALHMSQSFMSKLRLANFISSDILSFAEHCTSPRYDVIFGNYFMHLFSMREEIAILKLIGRILKRGGIAILSWVSTRDRHFGEGHRVADDSYEIYSGIPWRFVDRPQIECLTRNSSMKVEYMKEFTEIELVRCEPDQVNGIYLVASKSEY